MYGIHFKLWDTRASVEIIHQMNSNGRYNPNSMFISGSKEHLDNKFLDHQYSILSITIIMDVSYNTEKKNGLQSRLVWRILNCINNNMIKCII